MTSTAHRLLLLTACVLTGRAAAQVPVQGGTTTRTTVQEAQALLGDGKRAEAADLLGRYLAEHQNDGRAWFYLGRIYLDNAQRWHREGHPESQPGPLLLEFAGTAMEQAHQLLADSGSVFQVLIAVERATSHIENDGWEAALRRDVPAVELPLPPVLGELGRNIMASCPTNGVLVSGSLAEVAGVWGARLGAKVRPDLVLLRSDLYDADPRYRARMAKEIGVDSSLALPEALGRAGQRRPVCIGPAVDTSAVSGLPFRASRMVLLAGAAGAIDPTPLSVHLFGTTGLAGSVWTASAQDVYELAARRDRAICTELFGDAERRGMPTIAACSR